MAEFIDDKEKEWEKLKLKWSVPSPTKPKLQEKSKLSLNEKQTESESLSNMVNSLQKQIERKHDTLKEIQSKDFLTDLKEKKQQLDDNVMVKKQHIKELKSKQQLLQKEIIHTIQEIKNETDHSISSEHFNQN